MRTKTYLLISFILFTASLFAQKPELGMTLGLNMANWRLNESEYSVHNKSRTGFIAGLTAEMPVADRFSARAEALYGMFGSVFTNSYETARYNVNYFLLPAMLTYRLENGFAFMAGPELGILAVARRNYDGEIEGFRDRLKGADVFLVFGAEYRFSSGLCLGIRYQYGLTDTETRLTIPAKNRSISLMASCRFGEDLNGLTKGIFKK